LEDYKKAIDLLTIDSSKSRLEKQIKEIKEKSKDNDNLIKLKLEEKENQIQTLMKKQEQFQQLIQSLIDSGQLKPNM
jgi:hypothetical protein